MEDEFLEALMRSQLRADTRQQMLMEAARAERGGFSVAPPSTTFVQNRPIQGTTFEQGGADLFSGLFRALVTDPVTQVMEAHGRVARDFGRTARGLLRRGEVVPTEEASLFDVVELAGLYGGPFAASRGAASGLPGVAPGRAGAVPGPAGIAPGTGLREAASAGVSRNVPQYAAEYPPGYAVEYPPRYAAGTSSGYAAGTPVVSAGSAARPGTFAENIEEDLRRAFVNPARIEDIPGTTFRRPPPDKLDVVATSHTPLIDIDLPGVGRHDQQQIIAQDAAEVVRRIRQYQAALRERGVTSHGEIDMTPGGMVYTELGFPSNPVDFFSMDEANILPVDPLFRDLSYLPRHIGTDVIPPSFYRRIGPKQGFFGGTMPGDQDFILEPFAKIGQGESVAQSASDLSELRKLAVAGRSNPGTAQTVAEQVRQRLLSQLSEEDREKVLSGTALSMVLLSLLQARE